jgi:Zn-dependent protease with chaperone function
LVGCKKRITFETMQQRGTYRSPPRGGGGQQNYYGGARRGQPRENPYQRQGSSAGGSGGGGGPHLPPQVVALHLAARLGLSRNQSYVLLASIGTALLGLWFFTPFSDLVTGVVLETVPMSSDIELGLVSLLDIERDYPPVRDRWGVQEVGNQLLYSAQRRNPDLIPQEFQYSFDYGVIHADFINAFALPGGVIRVTDKLLKTLNLTPMELAALLGHEMGHVIHRHSQRQMIKKQLTTTVFSAMIDDKENQDESFGEAVAAMLLKGAAWLGQQRFSRQDEYQADEMAWDLLLEADMDPRSVHRMLQKLWDVSGGSGKTSWESTHPGTEDRIKALKKKWSKLSVNEKRRYSYR